MQVSAVSPAVKASAPLVAQPVDSGLGVCTIKVDLLPRPGRPTKHATPADRKAACLASKARLDYQDDPAIVATIADIARHLDHSRQDVIRSLVRFALTNRNWKQLGLYGAKGPQ